MKLPNPSFCGLYTQHTGAFVLAVTQCLSAFYVLAKYIETRLIQAGEMSAVPKAVTTFIFFGLIFNFILQFILCLGIAAMRFTICRVWLFIGIPGIMFWNWSVYEMSSCSCDSQSANQSSSDTCVVLGVAGIIYECYVWYVILAFADSIVSRSQQTQTEEVPRREVNANAHSRHSVVEIEQSNGTNGDINGNPLPPPAPLPVIRPPRCPQCQEQPCPEIIRFYETTPESREELRRSQERYLPPLPDVILEPSPSSSTYIDFQKQALDAETRKLRELEQIQEHLRQEALHREQRVANANARRSHLNNNGETYPNNENGVLTCDPPPDYNDIPPPNPGTTIPNSDEIPGPSHAKRS